MRLICFPVPIVGGIGAETEFSKSADCGRISAVTLIELIAGSFKLCAVGFEVGTVGKSCVKIDLNCGKFMKIQVEFERELDIGRQSPFGITHEDRQSVQRRIIGVIGCDQIHVGTVHKDLKVEDIAQRNGTGLKFVVGVFQRNLLELAVFFGDPALGNGQKHVVVGLSDGVHHLTAVVGVHILVVLNAALPGHDPEFT